uniref:EF-hand domain-containing protein n=1 Tax=Panagrellus redivivus TaxID=6233 RepID=A0A7E4V8Q0_PANRE
MTLQVYSAMSSMSPLLNVIPVTSPERTPPKSPCPSPRRPNNQFLSKIPEYLNDVPRPLGDSPDEAAVLRVGIEQPLEEFDTPKSSKISKSRLNRITFLDAPDTYEHPVALSFSEDSGTVEDEIPKAMNTGIKPFYVRNGGLMPSPKLDSFLLRLKSEFASITEFVGPLGPNTFKRVARLCSLPSFVGCSLFEAVEKFTGDAVVTFESFEKFYRAMAAENNDLPSKLMYILTTSIHGRPQKTLKMGDFFPLFTHVIRLHPCFSFLHGFVESINSFARVSEVLAFFTISGRSTISIPQLRASTFCADLLKLDDETINSEDVDMLSYIQFYVIRAAFEKDMSMYFTLMYDDLLNYDNGGFNGELIRRYIQQFGSKGITITDFAVLMFAHHEKDHPSSVRFWFRLCDLDDDGYLTFEDLYPLYRDIHFKMVLQYKNFTPISAGDYLLKAADCIKPIDNIMTMRISCGDIIKSGKAEEFFDYFVHAWNAHALEATDDRRSWEEPQSKWRVFCEDKYAFLQEEDQQCRSSANPAPKLDDDGVTAKDGDEMVSLDVIETLRSYGFFGVST